MTWLLVCALFQDHFCFFSSKLAPSLWHCFPQGWSCPVSPEHFLALIQLPQQKAEKGAKMHLKDGILLRTLILKSSLPLPTSSPKRGLL